MAGMEVTIDVKITHIEPTRSYIEEMDMLVNYLRSKADCNSIEKRMIKAHDNLHRELDKKEVNPFAVIEGGKP